MLLRRRTMTVLFAPQVPAEQSASKRVQQAELTLATQQAEAAAAVLFDATVAAIASDGAVASAAIASEAWRDQGLPGCALWEARTAIGAHDIRLAVALDHNFVVVQEEIHGHDIASASYPDALQQLPAADWTDIDGRPAGEMRSLAFARMAAFAEYVRLPSTERRLPIVLVSLLKETRKPALDARALSRRLAGAAHVIVRRDAAFWDEQEGHLAHRAFGGTVRVYAPDYQDSDPAGRHAFFGSDRFAGDGSETALDRLAREVAVCCREPEQIHPVFAAHEKARDLIRISSELQTEFGEHLRQLRDSNEVKAQETANLLQRVADERDALRNAVEAQIRELRDKDNEIARLQFQMTMLFRKSVADESGAMQPEPVLWLSNQAMEAYDALDSGEIEAVETQILQKLTHPLLRDGQQELVAAGTGLHVYPRSSSAGGRRVIFRVDQEQLLVCELYVNHDQYESARAHGFDPAAYQPFMPWNSM
ncbi:MAG: hypothetical protein ACRC1H_13885 [Caldilineaceae bacterium]